MSCPDAMNARGMVPRAPRRFDVLKKKSNPKPLTLAQANRVARGRAQITRDKIEPSLWQIGGYALAPMTRRELLAFLRGMAPQK